MRPRWNSLRPPAKHGALYRAGLNSVRHPAVPKTVVSLFRQQECPTRRSSLFIGKIHLLFRLECRLTRRVKPDRPGMQKRRICGTFDYLKKVPIRSGDLAICRRSELEGDPDPSIRSGLIVMLQSQDLNPNHFIG